MNWAGSSYAPTVFLYDMKINHQETQHNWLLLIKSMFFAVIYMISSGEF